jgi:pyruvate kinase
VRGAEPILQLQEYLRQRQAPIDLIAKIESAASIPRLAEIIAASDGIMIARGDLGAELPYEEVPLLQDEITARCRTAGKPVVVATHMLESMIVNPTPTRAEVTDITHAIQQGADAIMLCGETATGRHPFKALEVMDAVARRIEAHLAANPAMRVIDDRILRCPTLVAEEPPFEGGKRGNRSRPSSKEEISRSAAILGNNLGAAGTLVITRRGLMAALLSRCRPATPIFAFTNTTHVRRRLGIYWGVHALLVKLSSEPEISIQRAIEQLLRRSLVTPGDRIIVLSDILAGGKFVETVQVRII